MLLFRSLSLGLLGACLYFVVFPTSPAASPAPTIVYQTSAEPLPSAVTVLDVAPGIGNDDIATMIRLREGEHVVAVGERKVETDLAAGAAIRGTVGDYLDLTVDGPHGERRVLVLRH
jgi:hypothetical protein